MPDATRAQSANLDFLRAAAVMAVFVSHLCYSFGVRTVQGVDLAGLGRVGVLLFFVHTSLVLMLSLERSQAPAAAFYVRRFFRIYPLNIACIICIALTGCPPAPWLPSIQFSARTVVSSLALIQNITRSPEIGGQLWSLPYEVQMYALLPLVYWAARKWGVWCVAALAVFSAMVCLALVAFGLPWEAKLIRYFPCFLAGALSYSLRGRARHSYLRGGVFAVAVVVFMLAFCLEAERGPWLEWVFCSIIGLLIPVFPDLRNRLVRSVSHTVAKYSYGIYMSHFLAMWIGLHVVRSAPAQFAVVLILCAVFSLLAYHLLEAPMIALGQRVSGLSSARLRPTPLKPIARWTAYLTDY